ncbi:MAG TPA: 8-amino-7-oxononanoate synthase [Armatimonadota bacterium]|nr:8-amino-7-oxononanoate synthase [Armatimonadota bacterium]
MDLDRELDAELRSWRRQGLERILRPLDDSAGCRVRIYNRENGDSREVLSLSSNNYLGLAGHPEVRQAAIAALERLGLGSGASRLVTGNYPEHEALERDLGAWKGTEDAVLFDSGYAVNTGVIPALAGPEDLILSDRLNHASLIDGCRLSRAVVRVYNHADPAHARTLLADRNRFRRCFVVTDTVFSMDGDLAPLSELCDLAEANDACLITDDAHGGGVLGPEGAGAPAAMGAGRRIAVQIGTLSKALGAAGGFAAGSAVLCRYLRHRARTFVFSTGMPPSTAAGARAALALARRGDDLRDRLKHNIREIRIALRPLGYLIPDGSTPILPLLVGGESEAVRVSDALLEQGVLIPAIRYPTVPKGSARLRVTASAALSSADLEWLRRAVANCSDTMSRLNALSEEENP